jgi:PAS domain S-box-containing protein
MKNLKEKILLLEEENKKLQSIIESMQTELKTKQNEELYKTFMNATKDIVYLKDEQFRYIVINKSLVEFYGKSEKEIIGRRDCDFMLKEIAEKCNKSDNEAIQSMSLVISEENIGDQIYETMKFPVQLGINKRGIGGYIRNITSSINSIKELRESEERYRLLFERAPIGIGLSRNGINKYVNKAYLNIFGYQNLDEIINTPILDQISPSNREMITQKVKQRAEGKHIPDSYEVVGLKKDNIEFIFRANVSTIMINGEETTLVFVEDVTQRKLAEVALQESEEKLQLKLNTILSPDSSIVEQELNNILDVKSIQSLMNDLYDLIKIGISIIDLKGNILVATGRQDICTKYHKIHPETRLNCIENSELHVRNINQGEHYVYKCKNNLMEVVTPMYIGGKHIANIFMGQFFYEDDLVDIELYSKMADNYGFDKESYLKALEKIPRISHKKVNSMINLQIKFASVITNLGFSNIKLTMAMLEQKNVEKALRNSEEKFRNTCELLPSMIYEMDLNANFQYINQAVEKISGYSKYDAQQGLNAFDLFLPKDINRVKKNFEQVISGVTKDFEEYELKIKNGEIIPVEIKSALILNNDIPIGIRGVVNDITERKQFRKRLQQERDQAQLYLDIAGVMMLALDNKGKITLINKKGCDILGYQEEELIGNNWFELCLFENDRINIKSIINQLIESNGEKGKYSENFVKQKKGESRLIAFHNRLLCNEFDQIDGILCSGEDITDKKKLEQKIYYAAVEAEEKERSRIAKDLHDDLGPLLSTIKMYFQWLNKPDLHTPKQEIISNIESTIQEAISSIKDISHKLSPHILINFGLVQALKSFIKKLTESSNISISLNSNIQIQLEKDIEITLYRIIIECLNNTLKYAKAKKIIINLKSTQDYCGIEYIDDGIGFNYHDILKSNKGLGLFNMQSRVTLLGGKFSIVTSHNKGVNIKVQINI